MMSGLDLIRRATVAGIGIPLAVVLIYLGGWPLTLFLTLLAGMATWELYVLAARRGIQAFSWVGVAGSVSLVVAAGYARSFPAWAPWAMGILLLLFLLSSSAAVGRRGPAEFPLAATSLTVAGSLFWGGGLSFAVFLRHYPETLGAFSADPQIQGAILLAFPVAVTWIADSAAYFVGSLFGKHQMAPVLSPRKTVEGGVAGLATAIAVGAALAWLLLRIHPDVRVALLMGAVMGLLMGITVQVGDLVESLFKREAGVKDSGRLLPGHGGILDRLDALIFTVPLTYALIRLTEILS